eukprot:TRINITY_DN7261_c0_g3_i1.p1 TRINITY_DN7261_c0_g3~~TRINITY_DN7261_c0_g3_i1.p1  ORF type:complete len:972 (-),score=316.52 TRINITY_DN7261_c0_g3_i1:78-2993(-)
MNSLALLVAFGLFCFGCHASAPLNVHIIAHTHDDVGWLKTVDEYYYGANETIQNAGVQYILDTVISALQENPERRFIYVEVAFFARWWREQSDGMKQIVRDLVTNGQLEFINGGWCMNDEGVTTATDIIDQMTEGHQFLFNEFGVQPRIGWHIDPFGHSASQPALFALMGFDAFFIMRIDHQDYAIRAATQNLEFVWRGSQSLGPSIDTFSSVLYGPTYSSPEGFCFECMSVQPIMDDPNLFNFNIKDRADVFAALMHNQSASFRTNNILITFGADFQFMNARINFKNMDKLMGYINNNVDQYGINMFYSTPSTYVDAVHAAGLKWSLKTDDFWPYGGLFHAYWTGYFTSRVALKGYVRTRSSLLHTADQLLTTAAALPPQLIDVAGSLRNISTLAEAMAVAQHHDAVSGTAKQHVTDDYAERLSIGSDAAVSVIENVAAAVVSADSGKAPPSFQYCRLLNESVCAATDGLAQGTVIPLVFVNPLAWDRLEYARVPIPIQHVEVVNSTGDLVASQIQPNPDFSTGYVIIFPVATPALGINTYFLRPAQTKQRIARPVRRKAGGSNVTIENEFVRATFDGSSNLLTAVVNKQTGQQLDFVQNFFWYNGSSGNNAISPQASGAYIFRPNSSDPFAVGTPSISVITGPVVQEVRQIFSPWLVQVTRLYSGAMHLDLETTIQPMPIDDGMSKELIRRYSTALDTNLYSYTDANGLEFQQRRLNYRPTWNFTVEEPQSGNYYPTTIGAYINDAKANLQLTLVGDRARGCASLANGAIELMLQRRLLFDDHQGVGEPLNETLTVRTSEYVVVDSIDRSAAVFRRLAQTLNQPLTVLFGQASSVDAWTAAYSASFEPMQAPLPANVRLETLKTYADGQILLRLAHLFAVGEDAQLSQNVTVDISKLFTNLEFVSGTEMTLTANRPLAELRRLSWIVQDGSAQPQRSGGESAATDGVPVTLAPMQIRTFMTRFQPTGRN